MRKSILFIFLLILHFVSSVAQKPNVVIVLADDQGYGDMSCHGNPYVRTPNIDRLYEEGVDFSNFHVDPTCAPTRAALMTGRYSARVGVWLTFMGRHHLSADEITMADVFFKNGYQTGIFGKWHLGDNYPFRPTDRGFSESLVHGGGVIGELPDFWGNDYYDDTYFRNNKPEKQVGYCTDVWFYEAQKFILKNKEKPFFVYLPLNAPHGPLNVPNGYVKPFQYRHDIPGDRAWFYGMISQLDKRLGEFRDFLEENGLSENTIFIFMTDNGTASGAGFEDFQDKGYSNGIVTNGFNAGMRGKKTSVYEGGHRVACIMRWPHGKIDKKLKVDQLTAHIDILPTLVELAGLSCPEIPFDGKSIVPLIRNNEEAWEPRTMVVHNQVQFTHKYDTDKPVKYRNYAVMKGHYRLVNDELYSLDEDPGQINNIASVHPMLVKKLQQEYEQWWESVSVKFNDYNRTVIGFVSEPVTMLTGQSWHGDEAPYNQNHARYALNANGFWDLHVEKKGNYLVELRRYPKEVDVPINRIVPPPVNDPSKHEPKWGKLYESRPMQVVKARIKLGAFDQVVDVKPNDKHVQFTVELQQGDVDLQTWLIESSGISTGAYYVYVQRLDNE